MRFLKPISRLRRLALAGAVLAAGTTVLVPAESAVAAGNSLYFSNGADQVTVGANAPIFIDGTITFDAHCQGGTRPGIDDFVYPATDVYIVQSGSATDGAGLTDAGGSGPNTVVGLSSGIFIGELIAATYPAGPLGDGVYDIVYDTCQDGVVDFEDEVWSEAITVDVPDGEIPPASASIRQLKDTARQEYADWLATQTALKALFKLDDARELVACLLAPSPGCLIDTLATIYDVDGPMGQINDWFEDQVLKLTLNRARNYAAIWQDPADPDFRQLAVVDVEPIRDAPAADNPISAALAGLSAPLAEEGALSDALLHALERYQGAQAAGDAEWALVQARSVADLSATLRDHLQHSTAVDDLRHAIAADIDGLVARSAEGAQALHRLRNQGVTAEERQRLANAGYDPAEITAIEAAFVDAGRFVAPTAEMILGPLDTLLASRAALADSLAISATGWQELADSLESVVGAARPVADAGGPYTTVDGTVTLDGSGSTVTGGATIAATEWDLDGDAAFDDASGVSASVSLDRSRTVAVRITDSLGRQATATAHVTVVPQPAPSGVAQPTSNAISITAGTSVGFRFDVAGGIAQQWLLDGQPVGSGAAFELHAGPDLVGAHVVGTTVDVGRRSVAHTWIVSVVLPDADGDGWTATPDCDDSRADVHPGGFERIGNGRDDDCDDGTIDAPVGGATGQVWSWGQANSNGITPPVDRPSPAPIAAVGDQVIAVESTRSAGYAVIADGTVKAWASASGMLGSGAMDISYVPVTVKNVGGSGVLNGVVEVAVDEATVLARRSDGSVVAWGGNVNEQAGDGSGVDWRPAVVEVIDGATGQPLTGVAQVEAGETTSFGVMRDGSVKVWGVNHCSGGLGLVKHLYATTNPLFGDDVVQLASGDSGGAISLHGDGSVKVCSSYTPLLGRGPGSISMQAATTPQPAIGFGPGSGAIDVAMGNSTVTVLKQDGTVWTWGRNLNHTLDVVGLPADHIAYSPMQVPIPPGPPVVDVESDYAATMFAVRADGSVLVWGANVIYGAGIGSTAYQVVGTPEVEFGTGQVITLANSVWNGLAVVRPADPAGPEAEPVRPLHWIDASVSDGVVDEEAGGTVNVSLSEPAAVEVTVAFEFAGGSGSVVLPAGASSVDVALSVTDDAADESDEELAIRLTSVSGGVRLADALGLVTVIDDDAPPSVSISGTSVDEGDTSLTDVALTVSLSAATDDDVVVDLATVAGSAGLGGDVMEIDQSVLIPAGETAVSTHVYVLGDAELEDAEHFGVELSNPVSATLGTASATVTIVDDEPIVVDVVSPSVTEGDSGTTPATFRITSSQPPTPVAVEIAWTVVPGTAEDGSDVVAGSGALTLTGSDHGVVDVPVVGDDDVEPLAVETFRLMVAADSGDRQVVVNDIAAARIAEDDVVVVSVDAGPDLTTGEGAPITLTGSASGVAEPSVAWAVDQAACAIADPSALVTSVTCSDETQATLTLTVDGEYVDTASLTVDNIAPAVAITAPASGTGVAVGESVALALAVSDPGTSDALTCSIVWEAAVTTGCEAKHAFRQAGAQLVTVIVSDGDGGAGSATLALLVSSPDPVFGFDGFDAPVDNAPTVNVVKAGSTVPLKFGLGGDHGLAIFEAGYPASASRPCTGGALDALEETAQPGSATLTYDAATDRYHYNWKTSKAWAGQCRTLVLRFVDGTEVTAEFRFK